VSDPARGAVRLVLRAGWRGEWIPWGPRRGTWRVDLIGAECEARTSSPGKNCHHSGRDGGP